MIHLKELEKQEERKEKRNSENQNRIKQNGD
jgi:hypothetical protein